MNNYIIAGDNMNFNDINQKISTHRPFPEGDFRIFGVLVPIIDYKDDLHIVFEIRSHNLRSQPGEICLPGGALEKNEELCQTAIRETSEELNIPEDNIKLMGALDYVITPFDYGIYPFVGTISNFDPNYDDFNKDEVKEVFTVPLTFFLENEPERHFVTSDFVLPESFPFDKIQNGKEYKWKTGKYPILFYEYGEHIIWGITARIINSFIGVLKG